MGYHLLCVFNRKSKQLIDLLLRYKDRLDAPKFNTYYMSFNGVDELDLFRVRSFSRIGNAPTLLILSHCNGFNFRIWMKFSYRIIFFHLFLIWPKCDHTNYQGTYRWRLFIPSFWKMRWAKAHCGFDLLSQFSVEFYEQKIRRRIGNGIKTIKVDSNVLSQGNIVIWCLHN